jgi:serine/threonine-protein kinase RsbW
MTAIVDLELRGTMDHLRLVWQVGETLLGSVPFQEDPEGTRYNILLALQEMVTNVLRHAYRGDESKPVRLQFVAEPRGIEITLRDQGPPFDPLAAHEPDADAEDLPASPGGFGILIMKAVMESIDYQRDGDWNVLTMMRSVHPATPAARLRS